MAQNETTSNMVSIRATDKMTAKGMTSSGMMDSRKANGGMRDQKGQLDLKQQVTRLAMNLTAR